MFLIFFVYIIMFLSWASYFFKLIILMCFVIFVSLVVANLSRSTYVVEICFVSINFDEFRISKIKSNVLQWQSIFFQLIFLTSILTSILDENLSKFFQLIILTDVLTFSILTSIVNENLTRFILVKSSWQVSWFQTWATCTSRWPPGRRQSPVRVATSASTPANPPWSRFKIIIFAFILTLSWIGYTYIEDINDDFKHSCGWLHCWQYSNERVMFLKFDFVCALARL